MSVGRHHICRAALNVAQRWNNCSVKGMQRLGVQLYKLLLRERETRALAGAVCSGMPWSLGLSRPGSGCVGA